ncbi:threonine/serine exporter family protein [Mycolicibacterium sp. 018/SC-01/001]|uniref:threonine/serine exporter family protein n=1 Tax=Mycolicibacterium sp. 018/SC-01/001 TaxID=2592069 RepID=UPI001181563B|nr:threonine/serine exporter family protein [Mycolicibacterium sp. 018/SC-01/001]TRW89087.1 threonine/serine exporter family protein [Mycolicibacterium sp. 018/SC-01/001]
MPSEPADETGALDTILRAAVLLHDSGQSTAMTMTAVQRLSRGLGQPAEVIPGWSALTVYDPRTGGADALVGRARPVAVNMRRVAAVMRTVDDAGRRPIDRVEVERALEAAAGLPPSSTAAFTAACGLGAAALSIVFGVGDIRAIAVIAAAAALGGLFRRLVATVTTDVLLPVFGAALIAGGAGALAGGLGLDAPGGLVALCPAMVMVPGPQILIGAMDLLAARVNLALARLGYALLILAVIAGGLTIGMYAGGQTLPLSSSAAEVPFTLDVVAAGVAAACYPVFFSMPYRLLGWPIVVGMAAHAVHWATIEYGRSSLPVAALMACLLAGVVLTPLTYLKHMPFAAVGFAAVVSMVPGMYVFRAVAGGAELATRATEPVLLAVVGDGITATLTVAGMAVGLAVPTRVRDWVIDRTKHQ